jgi:anti-sigma factor RsiW
MMCDTHGYTHCLELFDKLSEYIDGETDETERREIEAHVAQCVACFGCLQSLRQTIALCKQAGRQPVPAVFSQKLQTMIQHIQSAR